MRTYKFLRALPSIALAGALGVSLMGAYNDSPNTADTAFVHDAMAVITQNVANAEAVQDGGSASSVDGLAKTIQSDGLAMGSQLASLSGFYGLDVSTDLPKAQGSSASFAQDQVTSLNKLIEICNTEKTNGNASQLRTLADSIVVRAQKDLEAAKAASK